MKNITIQIQKIDNGFLVAANSYDPMSMDGYGGGNQTFTPTYGGVKDAIETYLVNKEDAFNG